MKKLLSDLNAMPGPVWLFAAYGVSRVWSWFLALLSWLVPHGSLAGMTWSVAAIDICVLLAAVLPLALLWLLLKRSPFAYHLLCWYAGLKAVAHFVALFMALFSKGLDPDFMVSGILINVVWCGLWFCLLRYLERSADITELFPVESRRNVWWLALPMAALILICM